MNEPKNIQPPGWAQRLLRWYCKPAMLEDLEGDLIEYFQRNLNDKGVRAAKFIYILDVLKFFRPYTIKKLSFLEPLIHYVMLGSYIKTSGRNIYRNKFFSAINIVGLAISMSVGLVMISMLNDVMSYDRFHEKHARIYRVISRYEYNKNRDNDYHATTSMRAAKLLKTSVAGIDDVAILHRDFAGDVLVGEKAIPLNGLMADESFFNVFSFELINGKRSEVLRAPFSIVLTETSARKLFNSTDVLGKTLQFRDKSYTVTGVVKDVPKFSHFTFDMLGSLSTREILEKDNEREMRWDNMWSTFAYVLLPADADLGALKDRLRLISEREDKTVKLTHIELDVEPMDGIIAGNNRSNQLGPVIGDTVIKIFAALTFIVLLSACFNYTNLSIARSFKRSKEVGIRKTIGALRSHVASQFIVESVIISLLGLLIAFLIFLIVRPHFLQMESSLQALLVLELTPKLILLFLAFAIFVGVFAGLFPALFFSKLNAIQVLKNLSANNAIKGLTMRKVLIVFQYTLAIIFITGTAVFYKQYKHFVAFDLGFNTANIINIDLQGNKAELLQKELENLPEVRSISGSMIVMSVGNYYGVSAKSPANPQDSARVYYNAVDERYLPLHDIKLVAGRNFNAMAQGSQEAEVIVNSHVLTRFNISAANPANALGQVLKVDGKELQIIGVVDDFTYGRANSKTHKEVILRYTNEPAVLNVQVVSDDWIRIKDKIASAWSRIDDVHPLDARFYSEQIEQSFAGLQAAIKLGGFIAFLVIVISSIGLLGMVVYTTETRMKEVSIRKVLGASESGILFLLAKGFLILLAIAAAIALPITYLFFDQVLLPTIANYAPLAPVEFVLGVALILMVAIIMIGSQAFKVAKTNPAEVLKIE